MSSLNVHPGMRGAIIGEVILIRHCESQSNKSLTAEGDPGGDGNSALTELGLRQAAKVQKVICALLDVDPDNTEVWVSPLARARATVGDVPHTVHPELHECNTTPSGERVVEDPAAFSTRINVFGQRTLMPRLLGEVTAEPFKRKRVVVVGHSIFIVELLKQLIGSKPEDDSFFHLTNGSITTVCLTTAGVEVTMVGGVYHLDADERTGGHTSLLLL